MYRFAKYRATKVHTDDGQVFDSKKEYKRWCELLELQSNGLIRNLQRQVKYVLIPKQLDPSTGRVVRECSYFADFVYEENGMTVVEDSKGMKTPEYKMKKKLMLYIHHINIKET